MDWSVQNLVSRCIKASLLGGMLLLTACSGSGKRSALPFYQDAELTPQWLSAETQIGGKIHRVAPFSLTDQNHREITETDLDGKIVVANFFFTHCGGICPTTMSHMKQIQKAVAGNSEVLLLSYTIDPDQDTAEVLTQYARDRKISTTNWRLLTGPKEALYGMARASFFADSNLGPAKSDSDFLHTETFYLLDGKRRIRGIYNGTQNREVGKILEDIGALQRETKG